MPPQWLDFIVSESSIQAAVGEKPSMVINTNLPDNGVPSATIVVSLLSGGR